MLQLIPKVVAVLAGAGGNGLESLRLSGVRAFGKSWDVRLEEGLVSVKEA